MVLVMTQERHRQRDDAGADEVSRLTYHLVLHGNVNGATSISVCLEHYLVVSLTLGVIWKQHSETKKFKKHAQ